MSEQANLTASLEKMNPSIDSDSDSEDEQLSIDDLYALAIELKYEGKHKMAKQSCIEGIAKLNNSNTTGNGNNYTKEEKSLLISFYNLISQICIDLKEYENSIDYCKLLIELDSTYFEARYRLSYLLNYLKFNDLSINLINESLNLIENENPLKEKFKALLESIEKSKEHDHHHHHESESKVNQKIFVHLIRKLGNFTNLEPFLKMIEGKENYYLMTSNESCSNVKNVLKHNNNDIIMQCMNFQQKNKELTSHLILLANSSFSVEEFKNDETFLLAHSCAMIETSSFFNDMLHDGELIEMIETSNIFILDGCETCLFNQVKESIECLNGNTSVIKMEELKPNTIVHSHMGFDFETYLNDIGWMKLISNQQVKSTDNVIPFVFTSRKPLNIDKLRLIFSDTINNSEVEKFNSIVLRSKGFAWNCNDNNYLYEWSTLKSELKIEKKVLFLAAYENLHRLHPFRVEELKKINKWIEPMGDRRNEIAFICRKTELIPDPEKFIQSFLNNFQVDQYN